MLLGRARGGPVRPAARRGGRSARVEAPPRGRGERIPAYLEAKTRPKYLVFRVTMAASSTIAAVAIRSKNDCFRDRFGLPKALAAAEGVCLRCTRGKAGGPAGGLESRA